MVEGVKYFGCLCFGEGLGSNGSSIYQREFLVEFRRRLEDHALLVLLQVLCKTTSQVALEFPSQSLSKLILQKLNFGGEN